MQKYNIQTEVSCSCYTERTYCHEQDMHLYCTVRLNTIQFTNLGIKGDLEHEGKLSDSIPAKLPPVKWVLKKYIHIVSTVVVK